MSYNPYQSPETSEPRATLPETTHVAAGPSQKIVGRIRLVAILMIVQGGLLIAIGILFGVLSLCSGMIVEESVRQGKAPIAADPEFYEWYLFVVYAVVAAIFSIPGILQVWAGICNYRCRRRGLGIAALVTSLVTVFTILCAPTAIGLAVFGLIVYLDRNAVEVFRQGELRRRPA